MRCAGCGATFQKGEKIYSWQEGNFVDWICEDCFDSKILELSRNELAEMIGSEILTVEDLGA